MKRIGVCVCVCVCVYNHFKQANTWPIDGTLMGINILDHVILKVMATKGWFHTPESFRTEASPPDAV